MNGTTSIYTTTKTIDSETYQSILKDHYLPFHQNEYMLAQDNATCHVSHSTRSFLEDNAVELLPWAARSPDCNPIENLWGMLVSRLYADNRSYNSCTELSEAIINIWDKISDAEVKNLINSVPDRLCRVVAAHGGYSSRFWLIPCYNIVFMFCFLKKSLWYLLLYFYYMLKIIFT